MKLVVLAGAKKDATVPLKKERFIIGRAEGCSLRAGSSAISRKHCELHRTAEGVTVRDLGSRNGTYVNDIKISEATPLENGDRVRVGPLEFRFESEAKIADQKQSPVDGVAEVVERQAKKQAGKISEEDVSDWLLGDEPVDDGPTQSIRETMSFRVDETRAIMNELKKEEEAASAEGEDQSEEAEHDSEDEEKPAGKKKPGKLPKEALGPKTKDSREAAAQILRDMARRR